MGLVLDEVAKCKFNKVLVELTDPRFHKAAKRLLKGNMLSSDGIHPGRFLVSITYPQSSSRHICRMCRYQGERLNLYGLIVEYSERSTWRQQTNYQYNIKHYTIKNIRDKILDNDFKIPKGMRRKSQWIEFLCSQK